MESRPLLGSQRSQQDARFWVRVRWGLLVLFWLSFATVASFATILLVQAYKPPPPNSWHQRKVICRHTGPQTDVTHRIQESSALGCGGLVLGQEEVETPGLRAVVTEGTQYGVHIILEVQILEEYNGTQLRRLKDAARRWMEDGASGFQLLGGRRETVIMMSQILQDEVEMVGGEERLILLPDWLCDEEDIPNNKSRLLRTCPISDWNLQNVAVGAEVKDVAWKVETGDMDDLGLRQFQAVTLPGTIILTLNQSLAPPTWLRSLLFLRYQSPALYAGWLQPTSNGSAYSAVSSWGCSTLLVAIGDPDQSLNVSLPLFSASARLLLSTIKGRNQGQVLQDMVQLEPGEAQLLRLTPK